MPFEFRLPAIADGGDEGFVVHWFKDEGQAVRAGELLLEVQVEKVSTELTAPRDGVLARVLVPAGAAVKVGQPLCLIAGPDEAAAPASATGAAGSAGEASAPDQAASAVPREVRASPSARRLARELGVDVAQVPGTGPGGRVGEEDVKRYAAARGAGAPPPTAAPPAGAVRREPLSLAQRITGERMLQSLRESAQFTLGREVRVTALVHLRSRLKQAGSPVSLSDLIHRAVALALSGHPRLQAQLSGSDLVYPEGVHLGFAVARGDDLLVPVIRDAHRLGLPALAAQRQRLTEAVQAGTVTAAELQGATFTVSNLGAHGIDFFTPVLNPPQPAILGLGRTVERLVIAEGVVQPAQFITLSLTVDHRVVNGATGAGFLAALAGLLEQPEGWAEAG